MWHPIRRRLWSPLIIALVVSAIAAASAVAQPARKPAARPAAGRTTRTVASPPAKARKPELPPNFAEGFRAPLPPALRTGWPDSTTLLAELRPLAEAFERFNQSMLDRYTVRDTATLAAINDQMVSAALVLGYDADFRRRQRLAVRLQRMPAYRLPPHFFFLPYAIARQRVPDERSAAFAPALRAAWRAQLDSLPAAFRNDLINSLKGAVAPGGMIATRQLLRNGLRQIRDVGKGEGNYETVDGLLYFASRYAVFSRHRTTIEALLYELNPARVVEEKALVPLRTGDKLNVYVYRDAARPAADKVPAILSLSPYPSGTEATRGNVWATNGYVYVYADTRGRRGSTGNFLPYEHDAQDYYDLIDWASKQPWCDGQVATTGGSYLGFAQWQAIRKQYRHPALKAINPMVSVGFGVDFPRNDQMFYSYMLRWAQFVSGRELNESQFRDVRFWNGVYWRAYKNHVPFAKLDSVAGLPNPYFQRWVSHPDFDGYWRGILPSDDDYRALDLPVLTVTGYYDADQKGALYYYRHHQRLNPAARQNHQLLIGPWDHSGSQWMPSSLVGSEPIERAALVPIYQQVREWFDWRLKGKAKPAWVKDGTTAFAMGTGQWRGAPTIDAFTRDTMRFYLSPRVTPHPRRKAGVLGLDRTVPAAAATIPYRTDVAMVRDSAAIFAQEKPFGDSLVLASANNLVFESAPLPKTVTLSGKLVPRLFVRLNVPDIDFAVTVDEVAPDGKVRNLIETGVRARYRRGGEQAQLVTPGAVERYDFDNGFLTIKKIPAGARLRVTFEVLNSPFAERNYGFGGVVAKERATGPRLIEATLLTGGQQASRLDVPVTGE